jgi:hypothetical protein
MDMMGLYETAKGTYGTSLVGESALGEADQGFHLNVDDGSD